MRNFTIYLATALCLILNSMNAQENKQTDTTFEDRARLIATKIDAITNEEKAALKAEVEAVNVELGNNAINLAQADGKKLKLAEARAKNIETRIAAAEEELRQLVKDRVEGRIKVNDSTRRYSIVFDPKKSRQRKFENGESRTTSQVVFALGANNLVTDGAVANSDFRYAGSHFYEWGISWNSRILKDGNLLHAKYGLSFMYNNLRPTDNRYFVENGDQTNLEIALINLEDSRFRNVNLVVPVHLEFDFTKKGVNDDKTIFRTHNTFRFGIGGFAGVNIKSKQILKFEDSANNDVTQKTKGGFNTNDFIYGLSTYVGYKETSIYLKYDLNPLFENNAVDQKNISLGVRFDLN